MKMFQKIGAGLEKAVIHLARSRVREQLMRFDDRLLEDAGFSRELLKSGVDQWPWRAEDADVSLERPVFHLPVTRELSVSALESRHREAA